MLIQTFVIIFTLNILKANLIHTSQQFEHDSSKSTKNYSIELIFTPPIQIPIKSRLILALEDSIFIHEQLLSTNCSPLCRFQNNVLELQNSLIPNIVINISSFKQNLKNQNLLWTIKIINSMGQVYKLSNKVKYTIKQENSPKLSLNLHLSRNKFNGLLNVDKKIRQLIFNKNLFLNLNKSKEEIRDKYQRSCTLTVGKTKLFDCQISSNSLIFKSANQQINNIFSLASKQKYFTQPKDLLVARINGIKTKISKIILTKIIQQNKTVIINISTTNPTKYQNIQMFDFNTYELSNTSINFQISCLDCCKTYINEIENCTSCYSYTYLFNNLCVEQCPQNTYQNEVTNTCEHPQSLFFTSSVFQQNCSDGSYPYGDICMSCNSVCATCINNISCSSCIPGFYLNSQYQQCYVCPVYCANCTSDLYCTSCANVSGVYLKDNYCQFKCNYNNYYNGSCQSCSPMAWCAACSNNQSCAICTTGYVGIDNLCGACPTGCSNCLYEIESFPCLSCNEGWQYVNYNCIQCLSGYFPYNEKCIAYLTLGGPIPIPFTLFSFILILICLFSYIKHKETLYFIMFFSLNSLIQTIAALTLLILVIAYANYQLYLLIPILICQILGLMLNIIYTLLGFKPARLPLKNDNDYSKWLVENKWINIGTYFLSLLNMRAFFFSFSKAFGDKKLSATVQNLDNFDKCKRFLMYHFSFPILTIAACCQIIYIRYAPSMRYAPYAIGIDCLIVTILGSLSTIAFLTKTYEIRSQFLVPVLDNPTPTISASPTQRLSQLSRIPNI